MIIKHTAATLLCVVILLWSLWAKGQKIEVIKQEQLLYLLNNCQNDDLYLYNFWATWCGPCVEEIPLLEAVQEKYADVHVNLVSLDALETLETKVKAYITRKNLKSKVLLLDETDFNAFIDKIDERWSGVIPATVIVDGKTGNRYFFEQQFKEGDLEKIIIEIYHSR